MQVARIPTTLQLLGTGGERREAQKFSPGLPQNQTCGCWTAPANRTFDIVLNSSWVVTGLAFSSQRARWLREFDVQASDDNRTFLPWGSFTMSNFTAASLALFAFPIRARLFRVTVRRYANHYVNSTAGFPLTPVQALVSRDQPFGCACPMLSSGACCPYINMTVRNDTCVWCMDPANIMTRMVDGCGKCKPWTFEHTGRCYQRIRTAPGGVNSLSVGRPFSNGIDWRIDVNFTVDERSAVQLFVTKKMEPHPCAGGASSSFSSSRLSSTCCLKEDHHHHSDDPENMASSLPSYKPIFWNFTPPTSSNGTAGEDCPIILPTTFPSANASSTTNPPNSSSIKQFVQFDRGRRAAGGSFFFSYALSFTEREIRAWAACDATVCAGSVGALFITDVRQERWSQTVSSFLPQLIQQPLRFDLGVPPAVCSTLRLHPSRQARAEVHYYAATDTYTVRVIGAELLGETVQFRWVDNDGVQDSDDDNRWLSAPNSPELIITPPRQPGSSLRITDSVTSLRIDPPLTPVVHGAVTRSTHAGILVELRYGFGFSALPSPGDTDQLVIVKAHSTQPVRLRRLATISPGGWTTEYTTARGFISDARRVLDLAVACYQDRAALSRWLLQALQLLDTEGLRHAEFVQRSCQMVFSGEVARAFWLVPIRGEDGTAFNPDRTAPAGVRVIAEFA